MSLMGRDQTLEFLGQHVKIDRLMKHLFPVEGVITEVSTHSYCESIKGQT